MIGIYLYRRWNLNTCCLKMSKIGCMIIILKPAMLHVRRQQEKFTAMNDVILTVDTKRAFSADHQHQYPLRHHSIRMHIIAAKLIDILHANLLV